MLPTHFLKELNVRLTDIYNARIDIKFATTVSGGDINDTYLLDAGQRKFFIKCNTAGKYPLMFEREARGLKLIASAEEIDVPKPILADESDEYSYLIMEYINSSIEKEEFWNDFGTRIAKLHKHSNDYFGLDHDNYIGSLPQGNVKQNNWHDFFINERLMPQIQLAREAKLLSKTLTKSFEKLFTKLKDIFPEEPPALLHGDLWSGNFMCGSDGQAVLVDPAVYYGHREMDIGMSKLFGGFSFEFYEAYNEEYPLQPGWEDRIEYCNLYPLMVHVNLFGGGYLGSVERTLERVG